MQQTFTDQYMNERFSRYVDYFHNDIDDSGSEQVYVNFDKVNFNMKFDVVKETQYKYIKLNTSECPICLEIIQFKHDCVLTPCNHFFHKKCLLTYLEELEYPLPCPLCRTNLNILCVEYLITIDGGKNYKQFIIDDYLENTKYNYMLHFSIIRCDLCKQSLGMNKHCQSCLRYRKNGMKFSNDILLKTF